MYIKIVVLGGKDVGRRALLNNYTESIFGPAETKESHLINDVEFFTLQKKEEEIGLWFWNLNMESKFALLNPH